MSCECGPGAAGVNGGRLSCVSCLPGTFTPDVGAESCATCAAGSFVAGHGAVECGECDAGFYSTGGKFLFGYFWLFLVIFWLFLVIFVWAIVMTTCFVHRSRDVYCVSPRSVCQRERVQRVRRVRRGDVYARGRYHAMRRVRARVVLGARRGVV